MPGVSRIDDHADADHALAIRLIAEHDAHRIGIALGAALGGDAGQLAGLVVGGEEFHRSGLDRRVASADFCHTAARRGDELRNRFRFGQHFEHRAFGGDTLVGSDRVVGALVGADNDQAADRRDQAKCADHGARRRLRHAGWRRSHGDRNHLLFAGGRITHFFGLFGRKRFFGVTAFASSREM
jgi:hypothetical protein